MSKHILSLVLVLAIAGISSAATVMWNEHVTTGNWEDGSNWVTTTGGTSAMPTTNDFAGIYPRANGGAGTSYTAVTINLSTSQTVGRAKPQLNTMTLNINSGGTLTNSGVVGSMQIYGGTAETINIASGGALIAKGSSTGLQTGTSSMVINVASGGLMGVYGSTGYLSTNALWLGGTAGGLGTGTINVDGVLDADSINLVNTSYVVKLTSLTGVVYVRGTLSGSITSYDPINHPVIVTTGVIDPTAGANSGQTVTMYTIPEPATLALLGLGGLLLRRKK